MNPPIYRPKSSVTEQDHYAALARMVANVSEDHAQLRMFIYEFARAKLRKELYPRFLEGAWSEINEKVQGLETAIDQIEADFKRPALRAPSRLALSDAANGARADGSSLQTLGWSGTNRFGDEAIRAQSLLARHYRTSALPAVADDRLAHAFLGKHLRSKFWRNTELIFAVALGVVIYATIDTRTLVNRLVPSKLIANLTQTAATSDGTRNLTDEKRLNEKPKEVARAVGGIPVPSEYGVYAVINGRLAELEQLQLKVPDPRVAISATFSTPSRTHLPNGRVEFIVFRRDFANSAPDRVSARIIARVTRVLSFDPGGHAKTAGIDQSWVIRSKDYQMRVGPFADNPEMVLIHPDAANFTFPAGRYALVLKGVGYDFTVDGRTADTAHCLERTETLNAPVYTECRKL